MSNKLGSSFIIFDGAWYTIVCSMDHVTISGYQIISYFDDCQEWLIHCQWIPTL